MLISMDHPDEMRTRLDIDKDMHLRKVHTRHCSEFNKTKILLNSKMKEPKIKRFPSPTDLNEEDELMNIAAAQRIIYNGSAAPMTVAGRFTTSHQLHFPQKHYDISTFKKYFKRKNQFKIWTDAFYNNGVYFNPPVSGM